MLLTKGYVRRASRGRPADPILTLPQVVYDAMLSVEVMTKLIYRSATRLATLPATHPLCTFIQRRPRLAKHKTALPFHEIFAKAQIKPRNFETILPARRRPNVKSPINVHIAESKEAAIRDEAIQAQRHTYRVFSDGSGKDGKIGAAAVLYKGNQCQRKMHYHLGSMSEHTVYEAEAVGLALALHMLMTLTNAASLPSRVFLGIDNQAVLKALDDRTPKPGHHILDHIHDMAKQLIESMSSKWEPEEFKDDFRERLSKVIEDRVKSKHVVRKPVAEDALPENAATNVIDFADLLKRSLEKKGGKPAPAAKKATKKAAPKKAAPRKRTGRKSA